MSWLKSYNVSVRKSLADALGERVSVRIQIHGGYQDFLGILESPGLIRKKDGSLAEFDQSAVVAWRVVEPITEIGKGQPLTVRIRSLERAAMNTWLPAQYFEDGLWVYRIDKGKTLRANSVLVLGDPQGSCEEALRNVIDTFEQSRLRPVIAIPHGISELTENYLRTSSWQKEFDVHLMIADAHKVLRFDLPSTFRWQISQTPSPDWLTFDSDEEVNDILLRSPAHYLAITEKEKIIAKARIGFADDWGVLARIVVEERYRGRGLGKALVAQCAEVAREHGTRQLALHVAQSNSIAIRLYEQFGFRLHHTFSYYGYIKSLTLITHDSVEGSCC